VGYQHGRYWYKVGHKLKDGKYVWGPENTFRTAPYPGQDSLQRVIIFGDMGKHERDGSTEYVDTQNGSLIVTDALVKEVGNVDLIIHNGDIVYANGYLAEWDQFADQISNITNRVPYLLTAGNHERDWPKSGSFYVPLDSGGECGVPLSTMFNMPTKNKDKFWYSADWGKFHFCIANSEMDWRKGSEQYIFLEECLASVDRQKQPWLIFLGHRVLGYSSGSDYQTLGTFAEPLARDNLQDLWQKYKVDVATYGHVHNYERTCPVYQDQCVGDETTNYSGQFNGTIHIVAGTGGRDTETYGPLNTTWSLVKDYSLDYGYLKFTSGDSESLLVEFIHAKDDSVYDTFNFKRKFTDVLGCDASLAPICPFTTSADL
jgi:predicted phosphodiesterase